MGKVSGRKAASLWEVTEHSRGRVWLEEVTFEERILSSEPPFQLSGHCEVRPFFCHAFPPWCFHSVTDLNSVEQETVLRLWGKTRPPSPYAVNLRYLVTGIEGWRNHEASFFNLDIIKELNRRDLEAWGSLTNSRAKWLCELQWGDRLLNQARSPSSNQPSPQSEDGGHHSSL